MSTQPQFQSVRGMFNPKLRQVLEPDQDQVFKNLQAEGKTLEEIQELMKTMHQGAQK